MTLLNHVPFYFACPYCKADVQVLQLMVGPLCCPACDKVVITFSHQPPLTPDHKPRPVLVAR